MTKIAILIGTILVPCVAAAHPEHVSDGDFGIGHFLTDPFHVGLTVLAVLTFLGVRKMVLRRRSFNRLGR